jgi:hypothetical protein
VSDVDIEMPPRKLNRSPEEGQMRALIVPELRKRYPDARIIHELPLRYSTNRIDLAAVTPREIVSVEIKSSRDVSDRLEAQIRAFLPISSRVIVALAPKWNEKLPMRERPFAGGTGYSPEYTECQAIIERVGGHTETWTVDAVAGTIEVTQRAYRDNWPWLVKMLDILHVSELVAIAARHRCWQGKRPVHLEVRNACAELMTGREIVAAVCRALRERDAFAEGSDPPIAAVAS